MRIREIFFHNFRSFRGPNLISFVDPLTNEARPVTVIAGTNGSGKTTIFDAIEALLALAINPDNPQELILETLGNSFIYITVEFYEDDLPSPSRPYKSSYLKSNEPQKVLTIATGNWTLAPTIFNQENFGFFGYFWNGKTTTGLERKGNPEIPDELRLAYSMITQKLAQLYGGIIYFPSNRQLTLTTGGPIEPASQDSQWLFHFTNNDKWQGSLEQLWVFENYRDLEQGNKERENLKSVASLVEDVLGEDRKIVIKDARVTVRPSWSKNGDGTRVRLDQLTSGEQQVLLLFGELARRRRKGAVILIDEPELSLHPSLQRDVVYQLRNFAQAWDCQLIMATHSLEVLKAVNNSDHNNLDWLEKDSALIEAKA